MFHIYKIFNYYYCYITLTQREGDITVKVKPYPGTVKSSKEHNRSGWKENKDCDDSWIDRGEERNFNKKIPHFPKLISTNQLPGNRKGKNLLLNISYVI